MRFVNIFNIYDLVNLYAGVGNFKQKLWGEHISTNSWTGHLARNGQNRKEKGAIMSIFMINPN